MFCTGVDAGQESFQSVMDDGHSADLVQNFARAEAAFSMAYQIAQKSNNQRDIFLSLAPLLCAKIAQQKYNEAEPLYLKLNALAIDLKRHNKLEGNMLEDIDDICDAYEMDNRSVKEGASDPTYIFRMEHSLKLRLQFLKGSEDLVSDENTLIGWHIRQHEFAKAQDIVQLALSDASSMQPIDVAAFQLLSSCILDKTGATQKAQAMQKTALAKYQQLNAIGDYNAQLAWFFTRCDDHKAAIKFATQAIKSYESPMKPYYLTEELTQRASLNYMEKDFAAAEADYQHALAVAKKSPECWRLVAPCYRGLANVMHTKHNDKQANQYVMLEREATKQTRNMEARDFHDVSGDFEAARQGLKGGR